MRHSGGLQAGSRGTEQRQRTSSGHQRSEQVRCEVDGQSHDMVAIGAVACDCTSGEVESPQARGSPLDDGTAWDGYEAVTKRALLR